MVSVSIEREFDVNAKRLWAILADFADISWIPALEKVELEGEGVGMIRHVTAPGLPQLHERMDAIDHEKMILDYSVPEVAYIAAKNYTARAQVFELEGDRCRLHWSCRAEADGATEEESTERTKGFYEMIMIWIGDYLESQPS
jgi:hypothetical protein